MRIGLFFQIQRWQRNQTITPDESQDFPCEGIMMNMMTKLCLGIALLFGGQNALAQTPDGLERYEHFQDMPVNPEADAQRYFDPREVQRYSSPNDPDPTADYEEQRKQILAILPSDSPDPDTQTIEEQVEQILAAQQLFDDSDEDACCALLCLLSPTWPNECTKCLAKYFGIELRKKGKFSASRTASARLDFLNQCKTGDNSPGQANSKWGTTRR
jgi:hypothetical protein